jgi:hypothetical protein
MEEEVLFGEIKQLRESLEFESKVELRSQKTLRIVRKSLEFKEEAPTFNEILTQER